MPNKEPGAIRQLFAFVGERNSKMRISILLAVLGEMFGIVPFLMVALLADAGTIEESDLKGGVENHA